MSEPTPTHVRSGWSAKVLDGCRRPGWSQEVQIDAYESGHVFLARDEAEAFHRWLGDAIAEMAPRSD